MKIGPSRCTYSEQERLAALESYGILDTPTEKEFDDIVRMVSELLEAPIAAVNLIADGRQWFKSEIGLGVREMPLDDSICRFAILQPDGMVVPDTIKDPRFDCNPLVTGAPGLRFYAGELLQTPQGLPLGTLCVLDFEPRPQGLTEQQRFILKTLAQQVMSQIELRRIVREQHNMLVQQEIAAAALRESQRLSAEVMHRAETDRSRLDALLEAVPVGIGYADPNGKLILVNSENKRLWGEHPFSDSVDGYVEWKGWWADGSDRHGKLIQPYEWGLARALQGEEVAGDIVAIEPFGMPNVRRTVLLRAAPIRSAAGAVTGAVVAQMDITERLSNEAALRDARLRLEGALEAAEMGTWAFDLQGDKVYADRNMARLYGVADADAAGGSASAYFNAIHSDDVATAQARVDQAMSTGDPYTDSYRVCLPDGGFRFIQVRGRVTFDKNGKPQWLSGVSLDVTSQRQAERALRESEAKFRTITDAMPQMVWSTLPDGYNDYFNQRWYDYTGAPVGSTDGHEWAHIFHPDDQARASEVWRHSLVTGEQYEIQYRMRHRSGAYRWALGRALPIRDENGKIIRWMGTCTDIHDQKLAEEELKTANRRKDEFLAMLAHELRNPLAPISAAAQLLKICSHDEKSVKRSSEIIVRQVNHMTTLVDDLMDVSRVTRGLVALDKTEVDVKAVVNSAIEQARPLIESREHTLNIRLVSTTAIVLGDRARLIQVTANLLNNAAKYTPQGGEITLSVDVLQDQATIRIDDTGIGIDAALLPHVFELFTQAERTPDRSQGGLGLGLALVKSIMELHGGKVEARSEGPGQGSTFILTLPLQETKNAASGDANM
ncbi:MAG: PAS domain-containing protein, partial [Telluria sp.]